MARRCRGTALAFQIRKKQLPRLEQLKPTYWKAKSLRKQKKRGKKYISFYGSCTTQLLWPASLWVGSLGEDLGALWSLHEAGAPCAPMAETKGEEIKVTKQTSQV